MAVAAVVSLSNVPSWSMVGGDASVTAERITASDLRYRIGVVSDLAAQILFVFWSWPCINCSRELTRDMPR